MTCIDLNEVVPQLQAECIMIRFVDDQPNFIRDWTLHSSMDVDLLRGVLLTACRHRAMSDSRDEYQRFATEYKLQHLRVIRKSISDGSLASRRTAVTRAIMLVVDEVKQPHRLQGLEELTFSPRYISMTSAWPPGILWGS